MDIVEYAVESLGSWYEAQSNILNKYSISSSFINTGKGSASVRLETEKYLIDITAWNNASCLDIQILDVSSEESTFPTTGDCSSREVFEKHLDNFIEWFKGVNQ